MPLFPFHFLSNLNTEKWIFIYIVIFKWCSVNSGLIFSFFFPPRNKEFNIPTARGHSATSVI